MPSCEKTIGLRELEFHRHLTGAKQTASKVGLAKKQLLNEALLFLLALLLRSVFQTFQVFSRKLIINGQK